MTSVGEYSHNTYTYIYIYIERERERCSRLRYILECYGICVVNPPEMSTICIFIYD